jgi:hypothetical protein
MGTQEEFDQYDLGDIGDIVENPNYVSSANYHGGNLSQFGYAPPMAAPPPGQRAGSGVKPRIVKAAMPFWINMAVPFTTTANEQVTVYSKPLDFDNWLVAAWTQILGARVKFTLTTTGDQYSTEQVPLLSVAGTTTKVYPQKYWKPPSLLGSQSVIRGDFLNVDGVDPGNVVWMAVRRGSEQALEVKLSAYYVLMLDISNAALVAYTLPQDFPMLIKGMITNAPNSILVQFSDDRTNYSWSSEPLPVGAFAGHEDEVQPIVELPRPYFLPDRARIRCSYSAATSNNYIALICERLINWGWKNPHPQLPGQPPIPGPVQPVQPPPAQQQPPPTMQWPSMDACQQIYENQVRYNIIDSRFGSWDDQQRYLHECKKRGKLNTQLGPIIPGRK